MRLPTLLVVLSASVSLYAVACRSDDNNTPTDGQGSNKRQRQLREDPGSAGRRDGARHCGRTCTTSSSPRSTTSARRSATSGSRKKKAASARACTCSRRALSDVAMLTVGDEIDLKGAIKSEFALTGSGRGYDRSHGDRARARQRRHDHDHEARDVDDDHARQGRRARDRSDVRLDDGGHGRRHRVQRTRGRTGRAC